MKESDFDYIIEEPLLTDEGFVNPACMNALEKAIAEMPKTYERLADHPEWTEKRWTFRHDITGAFAKWAIRQAPNGPPLHLERVVNYLDECLKHVFTWGNEGLEELSLCQINKALHDILYDQGISDFDKWNEGEGFIDLDALLRNVCLDIRDERRHNDQFDAQFKKDHPSSEILE